MQPTDSRNQIEENTLTVPLGLQRGVFIGRETAIIRQGHTIGVIGITLVSIRLPHHSSRYMAEDGSDAEYIGQFTRHPEVRMLGQHRADMRIDGTLGR